MPQATFVYPHPEISFCLPTRDSFHSTSLKQERGHPALSPVPPRTGSGTDDGVPGALLPSLRRGTGARAPDVRRHGTAGRPRARASRPAPSGARRACHAPTTPTAPPRPRRGSPGLLRPRPAPAVAPRACSGPAPSAGPGTCPASSGFPHRPREAPNRRFPAPGARPATPAHPASSPPLSGTRSSPRLRPARSASASRCCPGSRRPPADPSPWRRCVRGAPPGTPRECEPCGPAV